MTLKGGTSQACAACKYQRRKCNAECPLAPYFPPDQPKLFQNAHKLFGVRNILRILKHLDQDQKPEAMRSIIYQSNMRDRFPINGCWEVICYLHCQLQAIEEEYNLVLSQLELCRQQQLEDVNSQLELGMGPPSNAIPLYNQASMTSFSATQNEANYNPICFDFKDNLANPLWVQHPFGDNNNIYNNLESYPLPEQAQSCDDMEPFFDTMDDRHSYIDSKEAYESSSEESLKDPTLLIQHVAENELKSAAASFSLTNAN